MIRYNNISRHVHEPPRPLPHYRPASFPTPKAQNLGAATPTPRIDASDAQAIQYSQIRYDVLCSYSFVALCIFIGYLHFKLGIVSTNVICMLPCQLVSAG